MIAHTSHFKPNNTLKLKPIQHEKNSLLFSTLSPVG